MIYFFGYIFFDIFEKWSTVFFKVMWKYDYLIFLDSNSKTQQFEWNKVNVRMW